MELITELIFKCLLVVCAGLFTMVAFKYFIKGLWLFFFGETAEHIPSKTETK